MLLYGDLNYLDLVNVGNDFGVAEYLYNVQSVLGKNQHAYLVLEVIHGVVAVDAYFQFSIQVGWNEFVMEKLVEEFYLKM